jgi:hypothetical protein
MVLATGVSTFHAAITVGSASSNAAVPPGCVSSAESNIGRGNESDNKSAGAIGSTAADSV